MKNRIGIMQGRLLPPRGARLQAFPGAGWDREFDLAQQAGLATIEWIFEAWNEHENPLATSEGVEDIRSHVDRNRVAVASVCADWFMERPLVRCSRLERREREAKLAWLITRASALGAARIVLPFVDASSIRSRAERHDVRDLLRAVAADAGRARVELHLETDLAPRDFGEFLDQIASDHVKVNYDSGNSASLGFAPQEELDAYGGRLGSVHVKDRVRGGSTVPLGTGAAEFVALFEGLRRLGYAGDFILQVARGNTGEEVAWVQKNLAFVRALLELR